MKELEIQRINTLTGQSYKDSKIDKLLRFIDEKSSGNFTGEITINFHKGSLSTNIGVRATEKI